MVEKVGTLAYDVTLDMSQMSQAEREVVRRLGKIGDEGDKLQTRFTAIAAGISAAISAIAIEGLISKVVSAQRQFDVLFSSLRTVTGGVDQASAAWERLVGFAGKTPYTLDQTIQGFVKLKALGLDPSERAMTSFGNTASAMGKDLTQMIEAVADASTGEFERLKEFGIKAKTQGDQVSFTFQGVTTTVKNNAADITEYLTKIGEVNFDGAMATRMETLDGAMSNLEDAWQGLYLAIAQSGLGDMIGDMVRGATTAIQELTLSIESGGLTEYFDKLKPILNAAEVAVMSLAGVMTARLVASIADVILRAGWAATAMVTMTSSTTAFTAVLTALGGPVGIAVTALGLLALNWDKIGSSAKTAAEISEDAAERIAKALKKSSKAGQVDLERQLQEAQSGLSEAQASRARTSSTIYKREAKDADLAAIDERIAAYKKTITDIKAAMGELSAKGGGAGWGRGVMVQDVPAKPDESDPEKLDKWIKRYGTLAQQLALEIKEARNELGAAFTPDLENQIRERFAARQSKLNSQADKARKDASKDPLGEFITDQLNAKQARDDRAQQQADQKQEQGRGLAAETIASQDPIAQLLYQQEEKSRILREYAEKDLDNAELYAAAIVTLEEQTQRNIKAIKDQQNKEEQESIRQRIQGASQLFDSLAGLTQMFAGKQSTAYRAMFAASKAFAIADSIIKIQQGIANSGSSSPFPLNIAAMGTFAANAASIISTIKGTNYGGGRQYGGPVSAGSMYRVNETGKSEMFVGANGSQYMIPNQSGKVVSADNVAGGGQPWTIIINEAAPGTTATVDERRRVIEVAVAAAEARVVGSIRENSGPVWSALRSSTNVQGRL
jgi:predicted DNA-binding WGR domain protein